MKNLIALLLIGILVTACDKKEESVSLSGQLRTYGTEEPVKHPPLNVQLIEREFNSSSLLSGGHTYRVLDEAITDEKGNFELKYTWKEDKEYFLAADPGSVQAGFHYYPVSEADRDHAFNKLEARGPIQTAHCYLRARGWVRFEVECPNPVSTVNYYLDLSGQQALHFSAGSDTLVAPKMGGYTHQYRYYFTGNDTSYTHSGSVTVVPFDTVMQKISF